MSADLLDALPPHKRELARLLLAARTAPAEHPRPRTGAGDVAAMPVQVRLLRAADPAAATGAHAVSLRGPLNRGALTRALAAVLDRHDALRTVLADHPAGPVLRERAPTRPLLRVAGDAVPPEQLVRDAAARPFDLTRETGARFELVRLADEHHLLVFSAHLTVFDGWSSAVVLADLAAAYRGEPLVPEPLQLSDVASWQHRWLSGASAAAELDHWRALLAGTGPPAARAAGFARGHVPVALPERATAAAFALGAAEGATPFMTLLAAWAAVLARREGRDRIVVGTPVSGRVSPGMEHAVGQFTTVVPIVVDCSGRPSFTALLRRVRPAVTDALAHQRLPVDTLLDGLGSQPYSTLFALHNYPAVPLELPGVEVSAVPGPPARHLELYSPDPAATLACVGLVEQDGRVGGTAEHNTLAVTGAEVTGLLADVGRVLSEAVAAPDTALTVLS